MHYYHRIGRAEGMLAGTGGDINYMAVCLHDTQDKPPPVVLLLKSSKLLLCAYYAGTTGTSSTGSISCGR